MTELRNHSSTLQLVGHELIIWLQIFFLVASIFTEQPPLYRDLRFYSFFYDTILCEFLNKVLQHIECVAKIRIFCAIRHQLIKEYN